MYTNFIGREYQSYDKWIYVKIEIPKFVRKDFTPYIGKVYEWITADVKEGKIPLLTISPADYILRPSSQKLEETLLSIKEILGDKYKESYGQQFREIFGNELILEERGTFKTLEPQELDKLRNLFQQDKEMKEYTNPFTLQPNLS